MRYEEVIPEDYLLNFVKCFWTSETLTKSAEYSPINCPNDWRGVK